MNELQFIWKGMKDHRFWTFLAWQDIKQRYRGSVIGPFWTVGNLALTVIGIGFLYSALFNIELDGYFPFLTAGLLVWFFISMVVTEATLAFTQGGAILKQSNVSPVIFPMRVIMRNLIVLAHNLIVFAIVAILFRVVPNFLYLFGGFLLLLVNLTWMSIVIGLLATRYRDVGQLIMQLMAFFLFVTPVFWEASAVSGLRSAYVLYNPFAHLLEIVRAPLLGNAPSMVSVVITLVAAVVGWTVAIISLRVYQRRVIFWI